MADKVFKGDVGWPPPDAEGKQEKPTDA